jgi:hypothetical protein
MEEWVVELRFVDCSWSVHGPLVIRQQTFYVTSLRVRGYSIAFTVDNLYPAKSCSRNGRPLVSRKTNHSYQTRDLFQSGAYIAKSKHCTRLHDELSEVERDRL